MLNQAVLQQSTKLTVVSSKTYSNQRNLGDVEEVYNRYAPAIYSYAYKLVNDKNIAEQVVVKAFTQTLKSDSHPSLQKGDVFITLLNVARKESMEMLVQNCAKKWRVAMQLGCLQQMPNPRFLNSLETIEQVIFCLMYYRAMTCEQIADTLKIRIDLIRSKLKTAQKKLLLLQEKFDTNTVGSDAMLVA